MDYDLLKFLIDPRVEVLLHYGGKLKYGRGDNADSRISFPYGVGKLPGLVFATEGEEIR